MDAVKELTEMLAASQIAIDTRGETPLRCTVDEADALDKKAKGCANILASMLDAAKKG